MATKRDVALRAIAKGSGRPSRTAAKPFLIASAEEAANPVETVCSGILNGLFAGRFVPGQRLVEADLTAWFKVSRGSARDALKKLAADGVVVLTPHKGAQIRVLSRTDVRNILLVMELLTGLAARLAAENRDEAGMKALRERLANVFANEGKDDPIAFIAARNEFLKTIHAVSGNPELLPALRSAHVFMIRIQFRQFRAATGEMYADDYREITEAIAAGDGARAERCARAHVRRTLRAIAKLPDDAFPSGAK